MTVSLLFLHLAGAATLLIWAVRMVRTGVERAYGAALRRMLRRSKDKQLQAAAIGASVAVLLQSSTAVAMLAAGLASSGILSLTTGLALLLGADIGSALVVQILSFDLTWLTPFLLVTAGWMFLKGKSRKVKQTGRILMGIALILVSLKMIGEATTPLRESTFLPIVIGYLQEDFLTAFLLGAAITWAFHSSVASILLFVTLAAQQLLPVEVGLSMMLGANLGGGLISVGLTWNAEAGTRRIPVGNLIFRGLGALSALVALQIFHPLPLEMLGASAARQIVNFHLIFNVALVVICVPLAGLVAALVERMVPDRASGETDLMADRISALDRSVIGTPRMALASATRELLRMGELVEIMLRPVMDLYDSGDKERIKRFRRLDEEVNRCHSDIKLYLAEINRVEMTAEEAQRSMELSNFAINLEHVGDIISKNLLKLATEKHDKNLVFSKAGWKELTDLHDQVMANAQVSLNVLVSGDHETARMLVEEKDRLRNLERESHELHLARLQSGTVKSIETSDIHLETVRALKQVNSAFASVAYPILAESGDLLESRLAHSA